MPKNLSQIAKQKKIKYFLISFVDLFGVLRSKLVPAQAIAEMQKNGAGFAGFATWLDMTPADSDMFGVPDPDSLIQLPWNKEVGWLASDLWMAGKPVSASPRVMLNNQIKNLSRKNLEMKCIFKPRFWKFFYLFFVKIRCCLSPKTFIQCVIITGTSNSFC